LDYHSRKDLVIVGFGTGECGLKIGYFPPADRKYQEVDYAFASTNMIFYKPYKIGSDILVRRTNGAIEKAKLASYTITGKYIKVVTKSKTWHQTKPSHC